MNSMNRPRFLRLLIGSAFLFPLMASASLATAADMVLVAHPTAGVSELSKSAAKAILTGKTGNWPNGTPVVLVLPTQGSAAMKWLTSTVLNLPETTYRRALLRKVFNGKAQKPLKATNPRAAQELVARTRGALTIVPRSALAGGGLKVVTIK